MRWSVVMPVYNEAAYLPRALASLAAQTRKFRLIVVDNGSTDGSGDIARRLLARFGLDGIVVAESKPGPVPALARGMREVRSEFVATCDADTTYPRHYLAVAERLLDEKADAAVASAYYLAPAASWPRRIASAVYQLAVNLLLPRQAHTGGAGQCFRVAALDAAGGYDASVWPYVLADHEIINRVLRHGRQVWHRTFWCLPSDRRGDLNAVRWSLAERLLYHATPFALQDRYFRDFLSKRLASRGLDSARLRERDWGGTECGA
jgi:glycosyltransferase involved in cell wall biosynthesis